MASQSVDEKDHENSEPGSVDQHAPARTHRPRMVDASRIRSLIEQNKKTEALKLVDRWEAQWKEIVQKKKNRTRKEPTEFNRFVQAKLPELKQQSPDAKPNDLMIQCANLWNSHKQTLISTVDGQ